VFFQYGIYTAGDVVLRKLYSDDSVVYADVTVDMLDGFSTAELGQFTADIAYQGFELVYAYSVARLTVSIVYNDVVGGLHDYTILVADGVSAINLDNMYLMIHQVTGSGINTNTLTNVNQAGLSTMWRISEEAIISVWLMRGMPDFTTDDMGTIIYAFGRN
jgi:hypothetical protein